MDKELVAKYLNKLKSDSGLTIEAIAKKSGRSESSVKNLLYANVDDPRLDTITPIVYALNGSVDEMINPGKNKDEIKEISVIQLREMYESQIATMKETNEAHINNIRTHYEQHREDVTKNYEMRLSDKREIIKLLTVENENLKLQLKEKVKSTNLGNLIRNIIIGLFVCGAITLLVLEFVHPEHGWIKF